MANNGALSFIAGLGSGMLTQKRRGEEDARIKEDRDLQREERELRLDDLREGKAMRKSLADAAQPVRAVEVTDIDPNNPEGPRPTSFSLSDGRTAATRQEADASAAAANTPDGIAARQASAYRKHGAPEKALTLESATKAQKRADLKFDQEQADHAKKLQEEGVFTAARALRSGDGAGFVSAFNQSGKVRIEGEPEIVKEERDVPGIGKVPTYTAKFKMKREDGTVTEETRNSHDLSMQLLPFEKMLDLQRKGTDSDNKANYQSAMMDAKIKQLELAGQVAEAKALKAAAGGGAIGREERLRFTSLFSDAGRRMGEAQRSLSSLQKDPLFMMNARKPGTPEAGQLEELQGAIKNFGEERTLYQGLLAGSQTPGKQPALADAAPKTPVKPKANGKSDYSSLWTK